MDKRPRTASNRKADRNAEILRRHFLCGETYSAISKSLNLSYSSLTGLAKNERERIVKHFEAGVSLEAIAIEYSFPIQDMHKLIQTEQERTKHRLDVIFTEEAEREYDRGMFDLDSGVSYVVEILISFDAGQSADEVAARLGIRVSDYYRHLGVLIEAVRSCTKI